MAEIDDEDCLPDSQHSVVDQDEEYMNEENVELLDLDDNTHRDSSINESNQLSFESISQASIETQSTSIFKKFSLLNRVFAKDKSSTVCMFCERRLRTVEASRLMSHVKRCKQLPSEEQSAILEAYQSHVTLKLKNQHGGDRNINELWARFLVQNNIALSSVDSPTFKRFKNVACPNWKPANRKVFSTQIIPAISQLINEGLLQRLKHSGDSCITVEFDHWTDINMRAYLVDSFTFLDGSRYLDEMVDVSLESHTGLITAEHLIERLNKIPARLLNAVISDSASACKLARETIAKSQQYRFLIQLGCMAHRVNRMGNMVSENEHTKEAFRWASKITSYASKSPELTAQIRNAGLRKPRKACPVRWYSTINMIESLLAAKKPILDHVDASKRRDKPIWMHNDEHWLSLKRAHRILRPLVDCIGVAELKAGCLSESFRCVLSFVKELFTDNWNDPLVVEGINAFLSYFGPGRVGQYGLEEEEFSLMLAAYVLDRRNRCDFITDEGLGLAFQAISTIASNSSCDSSNVNLTLSLLAQEYGDFCLRRNQFAKSQQPSQSPVDWWNGIAVGSSLRLVASRIVRLRSSSANIERIFSDMKWFQGTRRINMSTDTLKHLTRINVFEGYEELIQEIDGDILDVQSQQATPESSFDECPSFEPLAIDRPPFTYDQHDTSLLGEAAQKLYYSFKKYVNFTIVNSEPGSMVDQDSTPEARQRQLDQVRQMSREFRFTSQCNALGNGSNLVSNN